MFDLQPKTFSHHGDGTPRDIFFFFSRIPNKEQMEYKYKQSRNSLTTKMPPPPFFFFLCVCVCVSLSLSLPPFFHTQFPSKGVRSDTYAQNHTELTDNNDLIIRAQLQDYLFNLLYFSHQKFLVVFSAQKNCER